MTTGIGGETLRQVAALVGADMGIEFVVRPIGKGRDWHDLGGDWAGISEVADPGTDLHAALAALLSR